MICEILSVGTELLMGQIANTDAQYISKRLSELGINVYRHTTVGDNPDRVKLALNEALGRSDLVITTGGLGPTEDDLTKEMVAEYFGLKSVLHQPSYDALMARMTRLHPDKPVTANNLKQAYFPEGARIMPNLCGTAPGCIVTHSGKSVAVLPGPPREMRDMFDRELAPFLSEKTGIVIHSRFLRIFGVGESRVETILLDLFHLGQPTLALYCGVGEVQARITAALAKGEDPAPVLDPVEAEIRNRLGDAVYGEGSDSTLESTIVKELTRLEKTVCFAESCTGGMLASMIVNCPGASKVLNESYITYSNESKRRLTGVASDTLSRFGAVSERCAIEMAQGARVRSASDYGVSVTGVAGPDGGSEDKPVGTVYIAISTAKNTTARKYEFIGDRAWIRKLCCAHALNELRLTLLQGE
ncbi:MAG: competence/damage-inducible protein A [Clostridia bacterium]|nr:competence/damage-inducible protein A [Clostridia bacterium]